MSKITKREKLLHFKVSAIYFTTEEPNLFKKIAAKKWSHMLKPKRELD